MTRRRLGTAALLCVAAPLGCIERNAYLELAVTLPPDERSQPDSSGARFAVIRVNTGDVSFDQDWESSDALPPVALRHSQTSNQAISIEGREEIETQPVRVKVRFCRDANCVDLSDDHAPEVRYQIERAFYIGQRTSLSESIACIPNVTGQTDPPPTCSIANDTVVTVTKCQVAGCREGVTSNYCTGGKHFCEQ